MSMFLVSCTFAPPYLGEKLMTDELYEIPKECDFSKVSNGSNQDNQCSPKLKDEFFGEFEGILINAPKQVVWSKTVSFEDYPPGPWGRTEGPLRLMVAGLVRFRYKFLGLNGRTSKDILLVAVNQKTATAYSGRMPRPELLPVPERIKNRPKVALTEDELNTLITDHFNFDLVHDLGVPIADATYKVYATLGEFKSEVVTIKTKVEK